MNPCLTFEAAASLAGLTSTLGLTSSSPFLSGVGLNAYGSSSTDVSWSTAGAGASRLTRDLRPFAAVRCSLSLSSLNHGSEAEWSKFSCHFSAS